MSNQIPKRFGNNALKGSQFICYYDRRTAESVASLPAKDIPHIVLNLSAVSRIDPEAATVIAGIQQEFYAANQSCVLCCLQPDVEKYSAPPTCSTP